MANDQSRSSLLEAARQGFMGLNRKLGIEDFRQSMLGKLQSFGGGAPAPGIPVDANGRPMNTQYDMSNPMQRGKMVRDVEGINTPPQWVDHKNRMGVKHPDYQANRKQDTADYREWVAESNRLGTFAHWPKDQVEKNAWARRDAGQPSADEILSNLFDKKLTRR